MSTHWPSGWLSRREGWRDTHVRAHVCHAEQRDRACAGSGRHETGRASTIRARDMSACDFKFALRQSADEQGCGRRHARHNFAVRSWLALAAVVRANHGRARGPTVHTRGLHPNSYSYPNWCERLPMNLHNLGQVTRHNAREPDPKHLKQKHKATVCERLLSFITPIRPVIRFANTTSRARKRSRITAGCIVGLPFVGAGHVACGAARTLRRSCVALPQI